MKPHRRKILPVLVAAVLLVLCMAGWSFLRAAASDGSRFIFTPRLPVPPYATDARTYFDSTGTMRSIEFDTQLSGEELRQFYETKMADAGWRLECAYTEAGPQGPGDCQPTDMHGRELVLYFRKGSDTLKIHAAGVHVFPPEETSRRKVHLSESMYSLSPTAAVQGGTRPALPADYPAPAPLPSAYP